MVRFIFNRQHGLPHQQFYGDGERPVIGLLPKPADGKESEG
nr:hypothetical protein [uncultured Sphingobacterium sp.]